jgi:carbon storage regulator
MLLLKRKLNQRCIIGDGIVVQVVEIGPGWVRLGFEAPKEVGIDREEVRQAKDAVAGYHGLPGAREEQDAMQAVAREWLASRKVIAEFLGELCQSASDETNEHNAAAILARLAAHNPPILTTMKPKR